MTASSTLATPPRRHRTSPAFVTGTPRTWLRLEGLAAFALAVAAYLALGGHPVLLIPLLLAVDLSMVGYLANPRVGALTYNLFHQWATALAVLGAGWALGSTPLLLAGHHPRAHVGMDRLAGYGLKYPTSFHDTHLGRIGRDKGEGRAMSPTPARTSRDGIVPRHARCSRRAASTRSRWPRSPTGSACGPPRCTSMSAIEAPSSAPSSRPRSWTSGRRWRGRGAAGDDPRARLEGLAHALPRLLRRTTRARRPSCSPTSARTRRWTRRPPAVRPPRCCGDDGPRRAGTSARCGTRPDRVRARASRPWNWRVHSASGAVSTRRSRRGSRCSRTGWRAARRRSRGPCRDCREAARAGRPLSGRTPAAPCHPQMARLIVSTPSRRANRRTRESAGTRLPPWRNGRSEA